VEKDKRELLRKADIHFLHSVMGNKSETILRTIFPYLMITLEDVLVTSWNITGSGDDRPTESLTLKYDKAAMRYYRTKKGDVWTGGTPAGWNQMTNFDWTEAETSGIEFFKEPKKS
jgi:type VI protein secretion system component Hcp